MFLDGPTAGDALPPEGVGARLGDVEEPLVGLLHVVR